MANDYVKPPYFFEEGASPASENRKLPTGQLNKAVMEVKDGTLLRNWFGEEYKLQLPRGEKRKTGQYILLSGVITINGFDGKVYIAKLGPKIINILEEIGFKLNDNIYAVCANQAEFVDPEMKRVWDHLEVI